MRHASVGLVFLAFTAVACSDATMPLTSPLIAPRFTTASGIQLRLIPVLDDSLDVSAMNDWGEIVGQTTAIPSRVFKWQSSRGLSFGSNFGVTAHGVNNAGEVAVVIGGPAASHAAIWDWFGNATPLRDLSTFPVVQPTCLTYGITNTGIVFGACWVGSESVPYPTLWTKAGRPWALTPDSAMPFQGYATAMSDSGFVGGHGFGSDNVGPYVFDTPHHMLHKLAGNGSVMAVNDSGMAAGYQLNPDVTCRANPAIWSSSGAMQMLAVCGSAAQISADGIVVGTTVHFPLNIAIEIPDHAWIWTAAHGIERLPVPDSSDAADAIAINKAHQILGHIITPDGKRHTALWTLP
jgi:hypothetical protein